MDVRDRNIENEFVFQASRSGGPGGQNVNKVSTKVELRFTVGTSALLSDEEKQMITEKLANKINKLGELVLVCQTERSQLSNRDKVIEKFYYIINKALTPKTKRIRTKPSKASIERRIEAKKIQSRIKENRKDVDL
jgi:ribosome-associated protein